MSKKIYFHIFCAGLTVFAVVFAYAETATIIEGISYSDRLEFEKQAHKKWEAATGEERSRFLSGRHRGSGKPPVPSKTSVSSKSIFDTGKKNTVSPAKSKPRKSHSGSMGY